MLLLRRFFQVVPHLSIYKRYLCLKTELYEGHEVTITDDASGKLLYEGELTSDISISLKSLSSGYHNIRVVLDNAPNNPQNQTTFGISIVSTVAGGFNS